MVAVSVTYLGRIAAGVGVLPSILRPHAGAVVGGRGREGRCGQLGQPGLTGQLGAATILAVFHAQTRGAGVCNKNQNWLKSSTTTTLSTTARCCQKILNMSRYRKMCDETFMVLLPEDTQTQP